MATDTLRIGIIGAGANTRSKHIPGLRVQNSVEIVGVANRTAESSQRAATELDIPKAYGDWTEIIADKTVDAVCIGTWPYTHAQMTIAALDAGKHVLCEARMAMDAREAHAMLTASRRNPSRIAQIVPAPMTLPVDRTIADTIATGAIGNVIAIDLFVSIGDYPNPDAPRTGGRSATSLATTSWRSASGMSRWPAGWATPQARSPSARWRRSTARMRPVHACRSPSPTMSTLPAICSRAVSIAWCSRR